MQCRLPKVRFLASFVLSGFMLAVASCQSGDSGSILDVGGSKTEKPQEKVLASELLAYCPTVSLREGTAFFNTYAKGGDGDPAKIVYQASISDVTRSCSRANGMLTIDVAVAGKVVPGPVGVTGTVTMPIRVVVVRDQEVLYTQLQKYPVAIDSVGAATQFVFNDPNVTVPIPAGRDLQVFAGYDEGPPKKKKEEDSAF
jgi:hypothetical protein